MTVFNDIINQPSNSPSGKEMITYTGGKFFVNGDKFNWQKDYCSLPWSELRVKIRKASDPLTFTTSMDVVDDLVAHTWTIVSSVQYGYRIVFSSIEDYNLLALLYL